MDKVLTYVVSNLTSTGQEPFRVVEDVLRRQMHLSGHQIRSAKFREDGICLNGRRSRINEKICEGDVISVILGRQEELRVNLPEDAGEQEGPDRKPALLYEDDDLLVVDKPAGMSVHPAHGHFGDTLADTLHTADARVRIVGRLDKDTSGAVLVAKNAVAAARLSAQESTQKLYLALVRGQVPFTDRKISLPIRRVEGELNRMEAADEGMKAVTWVHRVCNYENGSVVILRLETGRTHQIRVHMAAIGQPLLSDPVYGNKETEYRPAGEGLGRAALHCLQIGLIQPFTGEKLCVRCPLPRDMKQWIIRNEHKK